MRRYFLDANVIFTAAHNPDGNGRALFKLAAEQQLELVSSRYAREEAARNITVKFPECVAEFNSLIGGLPLVAEPSQAEIQLAAAHYLPDKNVPILAATIAAGASTLVTGDRRDFGHLYGKIIEGIAVLTPAEAVSKAWSSRATPHCPEAHDPPRIRLFARTHALRVLDRERIAVPVRPAFERRR